MKLSYTPDPGMTTPEILATVHDSARTAVSKPFIPQFIRPFLVDMIVSSYRTRMKCDGLGCDASSRSVPLKLHGETWVNTGRWVHQNRLDFCPGCQASENNQRSVAAGVKPRGA